MLLRMQGRGGGDKSVGGSLRKIESEAKWDNAFKSMPRNVHILVEPLFYPYLSLSFPLPIPLSLFFFIYLPSLLSFSFFLYLPLYSFLSIYLPLSLSLFLSLTNGF